MLHPGRSASEAGSWGLNPRLTAFASWVHSIKMPTPTIALEQGRTAPTLTPDTLPVQTGQIVPEMETFPGNTGCSGRLSPL